MSRGSMQPDGLPNPVPNQPAQPEAIGGGGTSQQPENKRAEGVRWAKQRALAYLQRGDLKNAVRSMMSDMGKVDPDKREFIGAMGVAVLDDPQLNEQKVREFIEGFTE